MDNLKIVIRRMSDGKEFEISNGSAWAVAADGLSGFGDIESEIGFDDSALYDGGIFTSDHIGKVNREINAICVSREDMATARSNALSFFRAKEEYRVNVTYGLRDVFAMAKAERVRCTERHLDRGYLTLTLLLVFNNPYWKSTDDYGKNIAGLEGMIAFPYLCNANDDTMPKGTTGGRFTFDQSVTITNTGDIDTEARISVQSNGEVINPRIEINGHSVRMLDTMQQGDTLELDFAAHPPRITKNGINYIGHADRTSDFCNMQLRIGENTIKYDADNGSANMAVNVYYNNLYGAI